MTAVPTDAADLRAALEQHVDADKGVEMRRYMRDKFPFLGVTSPERRRAQRDWMAGLRKAPIDDVIAAAEACWREPEREFQYAAADLLRRHAKRVEPRHLPAVRSLIERGAWWDVVDSLAPHVVGNLVERHPELVAEMDRWVLDDDMWVVRRSVGRSASTHGSPPTRCATGWPATNPSCRHCRSARPPSTSGDRRPMVRG